MQGDMQISFDNPADLGSLHKMLAGNSKFTVATRTADSQTGQLSAGREFLELVFGGGGSAAAFQLIKVWIESKVTIIRFRAPDGEEFVVRSLHAAEDLERVKAAQRAKRGDDGES